MGLFSKIKKAFKKVVRGIGKVIKKVTKPFVKVAKAVLKPIGKVFGKLGFVGSLALGFMFGGGFPFLSNWFSGLEGGSFLGRFMDTVSQGFSRVMKPFKSIISFLPGFNFSLLASYLGPASTTFVRYEMVVQPTNLQTCIENLSKVSF